MRHYIALIHKDADSDYGVSFPDIPGVISAGRTLDEARHMGAEALALHLQGLGADGEAHNSQCGRKGYAIVWRQAGGDPDR